MPLQTSQEIVLAENTSEALRIVVRAGKVYKYLRPHNTFRGVSPELRLQRLRLQARESTRWSELNTVRFDEGNNCFISDYLQGERPTRQQVRELIGVFQRTGRGYLVDIGKHNVILVDGRPIVIDFEIDMDHPDWKKRFGEERVVGDLDS